MPLNEQTLQRLKNNDSTLTSLDLNGNQLGDAGAQALAQALTNNHTLTSLDLGDNQLGDAGAQALIQALTNNHALTRLDLRVNQLSNADKQSINELTSRNKTLANCFLQAAAQGDVAQVKLLLLQGVSIHAQDEQSDTALHLAMRHNDYSWVQYLINHGACCHLQNFSHKTAWQLAQQTPLAVLANDIKPQQVPSLIGFCLFKIKQLQANPDLLPQEQQQPFIEGVAGLPEELKHRLG